MPLPRKILYVAPMKPGNTSLYRHQAFERLGQQVVAFGTDAYEPAGRLLGKLRYRYPVGPLVQRVNRDLLALARREKPDMVWFDKPVHFTPQTVLAIKALGALTVCYNQDNPFGPRNDGCWLQFRRVFRLFDLYCAVRGADARRFTAWGLPFVKVVFSYDAAQHFPPPAGWTDSDRERDVSYVGSPHEERPAFLATLGELLGEVRLGVAGPRWDQAWHQSLRARYVFGGMMRDAAYRESIWKSKVNLAFLTHRNEDDLAHKSIEIAACGQFLLAERAPGHLEAFAEDREAVFFSSVEECAEKARYYVAHPEEREAIGAAARARVLSSGYDNDSQLARVLERLDRMRGEPAG